MTLAQIGQRTWALFSLLRPLNVVLVFVGVLLGGVLAAEMAAFSEPNIGRLLIAALSAALIGGGANSLNDVYDLHIDQVNKPHRPLPSGLLTPSVAMLLWGLATVVGLLLSARLSPTHVLLAVLATGLLFAYNLRLKRTVLWGNLCVALMVGLALVYGGLAIGDPRPALIGAVFAFLTTLAREIIKDVEDVEGDRANNLRTLPIAYGYPVAIQSALLILGATVILTPLPFLFLGYSGLYLLLVLAADGLMLGTIWIIKAPHPAVQASRASGLIKSAMVLGMAALACASWGV